MPLADVGDTSLWYEEVGTTDGPRCLVLHGGLGIDHHAYSPGLDPLGDVVRLVYYDHRAHGASGRPPLDTLTMAQLADDADALRAHLGEPRIGVLGHSFGGYIAYELAARHPEHVAFLVIVCASPAVDYGDELSANMERLLTDEMRSALAVEATSTEQWRAQTRALLPLYFHRWHERYLEPLTGRGWADHDTAVAAGRRALDGWNRWDDLERMTMPTLLVMGRHDFIPHLTRAEEVASRLPNGSLLVLEESGHYPWLEQPDAFFSGVGAWVAGVA